MCEKCSIILKRAKHSPKVAAEFVRLTEESYELDREVKNREALVENYAQSVERMRKRAADQSEHPLHLLEDLERDATAMARISEEIEALSAKAAMNLAWYDDLLERCTPSFPRAWDLLKYLLPHKTRKRVFEPAHQEMTANYHEAYARYDSFGERFWLRLCFGFRTLLMLLDCYRVMGLDKAVGGLIAIVPVSWKRWWLG